VLRDYWERVRLLHQHGVLEYEFFSAAADLALLALEGALRRRFVDFYAGRMPVIGKRGANKDTPNELAVRTFEEVWEAAADWDLASPGDRRRRLPTSLASLLAWARRERLLPGRRSRRIDRSLVKLRNWAAHPSDYTLDYPPSVARGLCQIAEYINMLWGHASPDGHTFKTHVERRARVIGLAPDMTAGIELRPDQVAELEPDKRGYGFTVLLAADDRLLETSVSAGTGLGVVYREGFQETQFPCERLFEGDWDGLMELIAGGAFKECSDSVAWLERCFLIREADGEIDRARAPADVLALKAGIAGRWWAITADGPWEAFAHVRDHQALELEEDGACPECFVAVEEILEDWSEVVSLCEAARTPSKITTG
jgi:hypothetical protein